LMWPRGLPLPVTDGHEDHQRALTPIS